MPPSHFVFVLASVILFLVITAFVTNLIRMRRQDQFGRLTTEADGLREPQTPLHAPELTRRAS